MITEVTVTVQADDENNIEKIKKLILRELSTKNIHENYDALKITQIKKSVDARHGQLKLHLRYKVAAGEDAEKSESGLIPKWKKADGKKTVIIVGAGPAGLFAALKLLESGIKPVILERGEPADERKRTIARISTKQQVDENSNYCFGEGGAGTFSDGKLYTRSNKRGDIGKILRIFVHFGADEKILTDAHPHIGTDRLPQIIMAMREKIISLGGEFHFCTKVCDFIIEDNVKNHDANSAKSTKVLGVKCKNTKTGEKSAFTGDAVILATGHSAGDIYELVSKIDGRALEAKTFAVGVRVEHPREKIDAIQFHGKKQENLGAAEYRLTTQVEGRGVYSFCMCPGGFVVPSQTDENGIVVNGMSNCKRNSKWSNAAIVVEIRPEDIPVTFKNHAEKEKCPALAGLYFRHHLEKLAKLAADNQKAPAQKLVDFLNHRDSENIPETSYTPGIVASRLDKWIPQFISEKVARGFRNFDKNMKGFICEDALLIAMETRTSTPVRILREKENFECEFIKGLYPCGEGSGYSGGIVSSAMDGENCASAIKSNLQ